MKHAMSLQQIIEVMKILPTLQWHLADRKELAEDYSISEFPHDHADVAIRELPNGESETWLRYWSETILPEGGSLTIERWHWAGPEMDLMLRAVQTVSIHGEHE